MVASVSMNPETIRQTAQEVLSNPRYQASPTEGLDLISLLTDFLDWIFSPFKGAFEILSGVSLIFAWVVTGLVATALVVLVGVAFYRLATFKSVVHVPRSSPNDARHRDPVELEKLANESLEASDFVVAVRLYLMATLLRLELAQKKRFRPGMTNREHLRRYSRSPIFEPMQYMVELMDQTWYGGANCDLESASKCRDAYQEIRDRIQRRAYVNRA